MRVFSKGPDALMSLQDQAEVLERLKIRFVHASCYRDDMPQRYLGLVHDVLKHAWTRFRPFRNYFKRFRAPKKNDPPLKEMDWKFTAKYMYAEKK